MEEGERGKGLGREGGWKMRKKKGEWRRRRRGGRGMKLEAATIGYERKDSK